MCKFSKPSSQGTFEFRVRIIVWHKYKAREIINSFACAFFSTDNHPAHHVQEVVEHIYDSGAIVWYLPPYSPHLNPIEEVFAKVKHYLRQNDLVLQAVRDPSPLTCISQPFTIYNYVMFRIARFECGPSFGI